MSSVGSVGCFYTVVSSEIRDLLISLIKFFLYNSFFVLDLVGTVSLRKTVLDLVVRT